MFNKGIWSYNMITTLSQNFNSMLITTEFRSFEIGNRKWFSFECERSNNLNEHMILQKWSYLRSYWAAFDELKLKNISILYFTYESLDTCLRVYLQDAVCVPRQAVFRSNYIWIFEISNCNPKRMVKSEIRWLWRCGKIEKLLRKKWMVIKINNKINK